MRTLIALMLALLLTGCAATSMIQANKDAAPVSGFLAEAQEKRIHYTVEIGEWCNEAQTEDGIPLAGYVFHLPVLMPVREDGTAVEEAQSEAEKQALAVAEAFNEKFEKWAAAEEFDELVKSAEEDLAWRQAEKIEWFGGYTLELDCTIYQTERLISVSGIYYSNTGGAHPNTWQLGWNFDLQDGGYFEADLLSDSTELKDAVTAEIIRQAQIPLEDGCVPVEMYWEDYQEIIANWSSYAVSFDACGMRVVFSPYELAPYAAGPQEFLLSYDWLCPYLSAHGRELLGLEG